MAERVTLALAERAGARRGGATPCRRPPRPRRRLPRRRWPRTSPPAELDELLDPAGYLGSAGVFVDRALDRYRKEAA